MGDLFQRFLNAATAKYKEADRATGGWLPGGGVASPLTRANKKKNVSWLSNINKVLIANQLKMTMLENLADLLDKVNF
jgi:hypothetical protein